jgi:hypothetical protein
LADAGTVSVAGGSITGGNIGNLQVGQVNDSGLNTKLVSVTGGGNIEKTAGANLTVQAQGILVDGLDAVRRSTVLYGDVTAPLAGDFTVQATGADGVGNGALAVVNFGQILGYAIGKMQLMASSDADRPGGTGLGTGTLFIGGNGLVGDQIQGHALDIHARRVWVDGTLQSAGSLAIGGDAKSDQTGAAKGLTQAEGDIIVSGSLNSGAVNSLNGNINLNGSIKTTTVSANSIDITGVLLADSVTARSDLHIAGPAAALTALNDVTAANELKVTGGGTLLSTSNSPFVVSASKLLVDGFNTQHSTLAKTGSGSFTIRATGADGSIADSIPVAVTIRNGGWVKGSNGSDMSVLADRGTIAVDGVGSEITGGNTGNLQVGEVNDTTSNTRLLSVTNGGGIAKTAGGNFTLRGGNILVDGEGSVVTMGSEAIGTLSLNAVGANPAGGHALTVANQGQVLASQAGDTAVFAGFGTVNVDGGKITGNNAGKLAVGIGTGPGGQAEMSPLVYVHGQGSVEKTTAGDFTVAAQSVLVDGSESSISFGSPANQPQGTFTLQAKGADGTVADPAGGASLLQALTVRGGGQVGGYIAGGMAVLADTGSIAVDGAGSQITSGNTASLQVGNPGGGNTRKVSVTGGGGIAKTAGAGLTLQADTFLVDGQGSLITMGQDATGTLDIDVTGTNPAGGYSLTVSNFGQLLGRQAGDIHLHTEPGSSILVAAQGRVSAANTGDLLVGQGTGNSSQKTDITSGGVVEKTTSGNLTLRGEDILIDGEGSRVVLGNRLSATGQSASADLSSPVDGNLVVEATAPDTATAPALTVSNGGQVIGNLGGGDLLVSANDPAGQGGVSLESGGLVAKTAQPGATGKLDVQGGTVNVRGAGSAILAGADPASPTQTATAPLGGELAVRAVGADPDNGYALWVADQGQITANTAGDASLYAVEGSSVGVTGEGKVIATNRGVLNVGTDGSGLTSKQVSVMTGGTIEKTAGGNTIVRGGNLLLDGGGSKISTTVDSIGNFTVEATGGNTPAQTAITIRNGGQLNSGNTGDMTLQSNSGDIGVSGGDAIFASNFGDVLIRTPNLRVTGTDANNKTTVIALSNTGEVKIQANTIKGDAGAWVNANNLGDLTLSPFNSDTLTIDPISFEKSNPVGNIILDANNINMTDTLVAIDSQGTDGGNILVVGINFDMIRSIIRNKGAGNFETSNNIKFDLLNLRMANSVVESKTIPSGRGGNISIVNGNEFNTRIIFGTVNNGTFIEGGSADWRVTTQLEPDLVISPLGQTIFAATDQFKLSENIRLSATDSVQAAVKAVIGQWSLADRQADLRSNPCEKEGSSLSSTGSGGYAVASSMTLPLPVGYADTSKQMAHAKNVGFGLQQPYKLAALSRTPDRECN